MTYSTYTPTGPFVDGGPPGFSAEWANPLETFIQKLWADTLITSDQAGGIQPVSLKPTSAVSITGTTAGTATVYQFLQGTVKAFLLYFNGYRNSTATEQTIALPTAFTSRCVCLSGSIPAISFWNGGSLVASSFEIVTTLPSGAGAGGVSVQSRLNGFSYADFVSAFSAVGCGVSQGANNTSVALFVGV